MLYLLDQRPKQILVGSLVVLAFLLASGAALWPWIWAGYRASGMAPRDREASRLLSLAPVSDRFKASLANVYQYNLFLRDYPRALTYYQEALRSNPLDSTSWLNLGRLYLQLDRSREADRALSLAVRLAPGDPALVWEAAVSYLEAGQLPEALRALTRFIAVSSESNDSARGYDLARRLLSPDGVLDRVIPAGVTYYTQYANYLLDRNRREEALRVWDRLKELAARSHERIDPNLQIRFEKSA